MNPRAHGFVDMPPMWHLIYYDYMYGERYREHKRGRAGPWKAACLAAPPAWFVAIAGLMWEGIIQGVAWDIVKLSVGTALSKLRDAGFAPPLRKQKNTDVSVRAGFEVYSEPGRKQYGLFLSLKRIHKEMPEEKAIAYARAKDQGELGRMVRAKAPAEMPGKRTLKRPQSPRKAKE